MFACLGDGSGASEGITSVSKPKPLLEFRKIGFVLPKESSRNYRLYIYEMIFFGWLWAPVFTYCLQAVWFLGIGGLTVLGRVSPDGD